MNKYNTRATIEDTNFLILLLLQQKMVKKS
jgi:hypothetical protein